MSALPASDPDDEPEVRDFPEYSPEELLSKKKLRDLERSAELAVMTPSGELRTPEEIMGRVYALLGDKEIQIDAHARQLRGESMRNRRLQGEQMNKLRAHPMYPDARAVLERWAELCHPGARELEGGDRLKNVLDRLVGKSGDTPYTVEDLNLCSLGYSFVPYVVEGRRMRYGTPAQRKVDAELLFQDPKHVEQGKAFAAEAERRKETIPDAATTLDAAKSEAVGPLGQAAIRLANFGWYVFPIRPRAKVPATANGLLDAKRDIEGISAYWQHKPNHNIGVRCGAESGIVVLDVDDRHGGGDSLAELEAKYGNLPLTLSVKTPSGGAHYYFQHPGGVIKNTVGYPGPGLDIRGDAGYVLAPPSIGENGNHYEVDDQVPIAEMPAWLRQMLLTYHENYAKLSQDERIVALLTDIPDGQRNVRLTQVAGIYAAQVSDPRLVFSAVLDANDARCKPPLSQREVAKIVESIMGREARKRNRPMLDQLKLEQESDQ